MNTQTSHNICQCGCQFSVSTAELTQSTQTQAIQTQCPCCQQGTCQCQQVGKECECEPCGCHLH